ncbi:MAG: ribbon-helix-helix domain-containing protein [Gemmatimonadetes bacterium]|nr:ribbon-helix-helix domain-containing protein [Gemmatimonadota bacterium]
MSEPTKTTVYLTDSDYRRLKQLARRQGVPAAKLVREAVAEYVRKRTRRLRPRSIGGFRSGLGDVAERAEEYLEGMGED